MILALKHRNDMNKKKGFTLIELVVAMAIFLVVIVIAFSTLSSYFAVRSANEQEMILQQNFRFAIDRISEDFRQAGSQGQIVSPEEASVGKNKLEFTDANGISIKYTLEKNEQKKTSIIKKSDQPITEEMHQLVDLYFVRSGGKITIIIVGQVNYFGRESKISFASLVFARNSNYEGISSP